MVRQIEIYTYQEDDKISELKDTCEENHIRYFIRDLKKEPLSAGQLSNLLKNYDIKHFIIDNGNGSRKLIDNLKTIPREEVLEKLAANNNKMLKSPIIVAGRLTTVGINWETIRHILYLEEDGAELYAPEKSRRGDMD